MSILPFPVESLGLSEPVADEVMVPLRRGDTTLRFPLESVQRINRLGIANRTQRSRKGKKPVIAGRILDAPGSRLRRCIAEDCLNCLLFASLGGTGLLIVNPRDFPAFVKDLQSNKPMFFMGVNTLFNALMHTPGFNDIDFSRLVATVAGGMALQSSVAARWKEITGCVVTQGWGLTEASPVGCVNPLIGPYAKFTGSIGLPVPSTEVTIRDDEGRELAPGGVGEICLRGPQVMRGYW